jgi:hypothetical protein
MDFNSLMAKMRELDQPTVSQQVQSAPVEECGDPMGMPSAMPSSMNDQPPPAHPSMSVNLNAQGMDNIESLLKLMTKVNPDMINQPMPPMAPAMDPMAMLTPPGPSISSIGDLGNLDKGPLKMLPDLDKEPSGHAEPDADNMGGPSDMDADNMGGPEKVVSIDLDNDADERDMPGDKDMDDVSKAHGDIDNDGDHDMDDHDMEKKEKDEGFQDATTRPGEDYKDVDYMTNKLAGGMNGEKKQFKHSYQAGDNPMAMPEGDLRASIRAELHKRLAEAKGAK